MRMNQRINQVYEVNMMLVKRRNELENELENELIGNLSLMSNSISTAEVSQYSLNASCIFTIDQVLDYQIEDLGNTKGKLVLLEDIKIKNANELFNDILADFNSLLYEDKLNRKKHLRIPNVILMKDCEDANEQELDITAFESSTTSLCPYLKASTQQILDGKVIDGNLKREDIINNIHDSLNSTFNITITIKKNQFKNNVLKQIHATKFEQVNRNKKIKLEINEN
ncbi:hypothetical protein WICANDRAFT_80590 [Wickerhamomyces anomalus NRRL Y-366-8]|uniref:Uncharacterized protein n=1 Tax=Wickerhamomyces anomalus (strain ATCC 58044 / CBS 1984 / NCYC 433 / NRRL Y-366-8) TaxID=683960 RepID=A0A1E3NZ04_WICAA|nr:uncharacterized protein WICANDRAFT_80590 [Wickerhamomyces anomalus NRRL Y-366-8]ODQ58451.1 hypothetical protein WICANDRAFT_80590 [Wickerhamomyces anomalus NRRL Y-366-8]